MRIENASAIVATEPIAGDVEYESDQPHLDGFSVRVSFDLPGGATVSHFAHPWGPVPGRGKFPFQLSALKNPEVESPAELPGTLVVFFCLCRQGPGDDAPAQPISNTWAGLIDLV